MFNSLHLMFMTQYTELWNAVDPIAERIRSLGQPAPGSYAQFAKLSSLPDVPEVPPKALEMVDVLAKGHEATARPARALRSEEHTSELQSLMRNSYAVLCLQKKT